MATNRCAYITLVTSDAYVQGALVLFHSIRLTGSSLPVICMVTAPSLSPTNLACLEDTFNAIIPVSATVSANTAGLLMLGRPDLASTLTKIELWHPSLTQNWDVLLYLDADTLVHHNIDHVFDRSASWQHDNSGANPISAPSNAVSSSWEQGGLIAAAPDIGWPDCFNSGVLLIRPGADCYSQLVSKACNSQNNGSFDGEFDFALNSPLDSLLWL